MPETEGWNKKEGEQNMNRSKEEERVRMREFVICMCVLLSLIQKNIIDAAIHGDPAGGNKKEPRKRRYYIVARVLPCMWLMEI
jgi:hypothetical protein